MKEFVLNITVIVIVCFVLGLILEGTRFEKSSSRIFSLIIIANLIISLCSLFNFSNNDINFEIPIDTSYIENINSYKINMIKDKLLENLKRVGVENCGIYFSTKVNGYDIEISKVHVDLSVCEYDEKVLNIDEVKNIIVEMLQIDKENIIVYN